MSRNFTLDEIENMRVRLEAGEPVQSVADDYDTCHKTVRYHADPDRKARLQAAKRQGYRNRIAELPPTGLGQVSEQDLKRGIAQAGRRLHLPITRMMSQVIREEIMNARARRLRGEPEPPREIPPAKAAALAIARN